MDDSGNNLMDFTLAAIYLFIPSLPVTHSLGLVAHCPKAAKARHLILYPVKGGKHHMIFQLISWVIWAASVLVAAPVVFQRTTSDIPETHAEVLSTTAAVGGIFAELFMIQSLLVFDPKCHTLSQGTEQPLSPIYRRSAIPKPTAATVLIGMGALWVSLAAALIWATEFLENVATKKVYIYFSGACLLVGILTTHGLGGKLWHASGLGEETVGNAWRFYQPFKGGGAFVATQALGWVLFSTSLTSLLWLVSRIAAGVAYCIRCWALGTCIAMAAAYVVLSASIWVFRVPYPSHRDLATLKEAIRELPTDRISWASMWLPILALYTPVHIFSCVVVSSFISLPATFAGAFWLGSLTLYYATTLQNQPQHTGCREWPLIKTWLSKQLQPALNAWFGNVEVAYDGKLPFPSHLKCIFGYAPHGLFPIGAPYMTLLPQFKRLFPTVDPVPLVASVCFYTPIVRDLCSWCGLRQVSKATFLRALAERGSVLLVPGGQAELVQTSRFFSKKEFVLYSQHRGFVRLAIEQNAALVPVLCLGEMAALRNLFDCPSWQQWTYKTVGFPIPYLVVGRWGITPFPRRTSLKFIVGEPLMPPTHTSTGQVNEADVHSFHKRYYEALANLYKGNHTTFPGHEDVKLVIE